jgi:hypothetical protein
MSRKRPVPLRVKIGIAGIAGVAAAWLIPRPGSTPAPVPSPTSSSAVTAVQARLVDVPEGVSFRVVDGVRVFLSRTSADVAGIEGTLPSAVATAAIYWCARNEQFQDAGGNARWDRMGSPLAGSTYMLDHLHVLVTAGTVTIFPHTAIRGAAAQPPAGIRLTSPCSASERVG